MSTKITKKARLFWLLPRKVYIITNNKKGSAMKILFLILVSAFITTSSFTQDKAKDVIYLKNGSIIRGTIIEVIPNQSIKIKTSDENIFVFKMEEVEKALHSSEEKERSSREQNNDFTLNSQIFGISFGTNPYASGEFLLKEKELLYYDGFDNYYVINHVVSKLTAKNVTGHIYIPKLQTDNINFGLSISYVNGKYQNSETDSGRNGSKLNREFKIDGIQIDGDIKFISAFSQWAPFCGFGISYINFTGATSMVRDYNNPITKDKSTKYDVSMSGWVQYFEVGSYFELNSKLSAFFEFKKMGISFIKLKSESDAYKIEEDLVSKQGLDDVGISLGIRFGL
ncbi:MAG: hypothetical protein QME52_07000 [Bacteroidota bacterium]|nr:hypothetical protein [Bacteroidota bacterium]